MFFPISCQTPSLADFMLAAQRGDPASRMIVEGGRVRTVSKRSHELTPDINKRTRKAFTRALSESLTPKKIRHICARYNIDWSRMRNSDMPLKRFYIDAFGVGISCLSTYNLRENWWLPQSLEALSSTQVRRCVEEALRFSYLGNELDPVDVKGGATKDFQMFASDFFITDKNRAALFKGIGDLVSHDPNIPYMHPYYSRLSMGIISHMEEKFEIRDRELVIPAPGRIEGEVDYYKVHDIVSYGGLTAVFMTPISGSSHLAPLVVFRCTQQTLTRTDAIPSMLNDMEHNIGESGYIASKEALAKAMKDKKFHRGKKVKVISYSLGGAHATYFMADHWPVVEEFIGFNFCGTSAEVVESIADGINKLDESAIPPRIYIHRNVCTKDGRRGDWVNKTGDKHIGWGIKHPNSVVQLCEWFVHDHNVSENIYDPKAWAAWWELHAVRPMDCKETYSYTLFRGPTQCSQRLDTFKRDGGLERQRRLLGPDVIAKVIKGGYSTLDFFLRVFGVDFFRRNMR